jgi:hypothetical protein
MARTLPDPELTRRAYPELTRCDHCGVLDDRVECVGLAFARQDEGDGFTWLHRECQDQFEPVHSQPFQRLGDVVKRPLPSWAQGERKTPAPPRSNIRARLLARDHDRPGVRCGGGIYWCACANLADRNRHRYRWEFFVDANWNKVMERAPPHKIICAYCRKDDGVIQFACIGEPKKKVVEVWLHEACERGYLRLLDEPVA